MQDSVKTNFVQGYNGQVVDAQYTNIESAIVAKESSVPFGIFVVADDSTGAPEGLGGALRRQVARPPTGEDDLTTGIGLGISLADTIESAGGDTPPVFPEGKAFPVLRKGKAWVISEDSVVNGGPVWVRHTTENGDIVGQLAGADGGNHFLLPNLIWRSTNDAGLSIVEVNLPGPPAGPEGPEGPPAIP